MTYEQLETVTTVTKNDLDLFFRAQIRAIAIL